MEQIAVSFTDGGVPKTGLTPKVTILDRAGKVYVTNGELKELGYGWYIYNFAKYSPEKVYLYIFDGGDTLSNSYDRYIFGGNELDAYSNKYSWGRTAAPYFTSVNGRFDGLDKAIKGMDKLKYDDGEVKKSLNEIRKEVKRGALYDKINGLSDILNEIKQSVVDTSATNEGNSSKNFSGINGKLDLLAEYIVKMKEDVDTELGTLDENVAQRITETNTNLNEGLSKGVTIEQLLQQVERIENKLNEVVDGIVQEKLPSNLLDNYNITATRKPTMSDEEMMAAIGMGEGLNEGLNQGMEEGINEGVEMGMGEGMGTPREQGVNAPVDMQGIAEPEMPLGY